MKTFSRLLVLALVFSTSLTTLRALDGGDSFTLNLPYSLNAATPAWLDHPIAGSSPFASLNLPITPPDATASLLVTVFFQEQNGGFLRISWQSAALSDGEQALPGPGEAALSSVLSDNFYEGIGMSNQRSLLIPAKVMAQAGSLSFQTGSATLGISRIQMEWLENSAGLSSPTIQDTLVTPAAGPTQIASELAGNPALAQDPVWQGSIVDVPVTDVPLRIEQGLDFSVQIDTPPALARIALKETGLPWGQHLVVWVNNQRAGLIIPSAPSLANGGYGSAATDTYIGWREGTFMIPANTLMAGANTLQFSAEPDVTPTMAPDPNTPAVPLAIKDVVVQLAYPAPTPVAGNSESSIKVIPAPPVSTANQTASPDSAALAPTSAASSSLTPNP